MFSVVSTNDTPVLPFIIQPEAVTPEMDVRRVMTRCAGFELPRFFNSEPAALPRLSLALTAALMVQRKDKQAVIVLATARSILSQIDGIEEALERAVQVARTGKIVEVAVSRPGEETAAAAIHGVAGGYHLGEFQEKDAAEYDGTGMFVLRADSFLTEAEILCGALLTQCQDCLTLGETAPQASDSALDDLATLSFWNGFWTRTDNRAAVVIGEQPETLPLDIPAQAQTRTRRSVRG